eukprot:Opistho-2@95414
MAQAAPGQLHGLVAAAIVQHVPAADLQLARPGQHGRRRHRAALGHHFQSLGLVAGQVAHQRLVDLDLVLALGQQGFQRFQLVHQLVQALARDGRRLGGEGRSQRVVERAHMLVLFVAGQTGLAHAVAQGLQERRQATDHLGTLFPRDLGAGRPDQVGRSTLHGLGRVGLGAGTHGRDSQHISPDVEQELAHAGLHRHLVEHLAQLDGVLDRQGLALLDLLGQGYALLGGLVLALEIVVEKFLELGQHRGEDAPAGVGIGLDHLHHALDLALQRIAAGRGIAGRSGAEAHHAGTHAVDQLARRVVGGSEEIGLADGHAQHRHLQAGEPDPHRGWAHVLC